MKLNFPWLIVILFIVCLPLTACSPAPSVESGAPTSVEIERLESETEPTRVTLSPEAITRLDIKSSPVRNVQVDGANLKYTFQPVTSEEPGTYTVSVYAVRKDNSLNQAFVLSDFQLGTATAEKQIVDKQNCAPCHLGAASNQFYLHHVDPGRSPTGSPSA